MRQTTCYLLPAPCYVLPTTYYHCDDDNHCYHHYYRVTTANYQLCGLSYDNTITTSTQIKNCLGWLGQVAQASGCICHTFPSLQPMADFCHDTVKPAPNHGADPPESSNSIIV